MDCWNCRIHEFILKQIGTPWFIIIRCKIHCFILFHQLNGILPAALLHLHIYFVYHFQIQCILNITIVIILLSNIFLFLYLIIAIIIILNTFDLFPLFAIGYVRIVACNRFFQSFFLSFAFHYCYWSCYCLWCNFCCLLFLFYDCYCQHQLQSNHHVISYFFRKWCTSILNFIILVNVILINSNSVHV